MLSFYRYDKILSSMLKENSDVGLTIGTCIFCLCKIMLNLPVWNRGWYTEESGLVLANEIVVIVIRN